MLRWTIELRESKFSDVWVEVQQASGRRHRYAEQADAIAMMEKMKGTQPQATYRVRELSHR